MRLLALWENQDRAQSSSFVSAEEIQQNATVSLTAISKQDFQRGTTMVRPQEQMFVCRRAVFEGLLD
jgi:hypothetical protein